MYYIHIHHIFANTQIKNNDYVSLLAQTFIVKHVAYPTQSSKCKKVKRLNGEFYRKTCHRLYSSNYL